MSLPSPKTNSIGHFVLALIVCLAATSAPAQFFPSPFDKADPADRVPLYTGLHRFSELSAARLYDMNLAVKRGRPIRVANCTVSQSKTVIRTAASDHAAAIELVKTLCD